MKGKGKGKRTRKIDGEEHDSKTLGADVVRQNLCDVTDEETAPGEIVHGVVEEDHSQDSLAGGVVGVVGSSKAAGGDGPGDVGDEHAGCGDEEEGTTAEAVDVEAWRKKRVSECGLRGERR